MSRYYDPTTQTESLDETGTSIEDMPPASRAWFDSDPAPAGKRWANDPTNKFPVLVDIPPPTAEENAADDRAWAARELAVTDKILFSDSPYSEGHQTLVRTYRNALRTPQRTAENWTRPTWPDGVKRPQ